MTDKQIIDTTRCAWKSLEGTLCPEAQEQLDQLKAENEELKELNTRLDRQREAYWKGYQKLDKALTEIKEIAEDQKDVLESMRIDIAEQILQKISEVIKDENI